MRAGLGRALAICLAQAVPTPALAQVDGPREAERFQIGTEGALCEAQGVRLGEPRQSLFDRKWALICKDVDRPIGSAYIWRGAPDALARVAQDRNSPLDCAAAVPAEGLPTGTTIRRCRDTASGLEWNSYEFHQNGWDNVVEGLSVFDGALRLTLASLAQNRVVPGPVDIVTTGGSGSFAQARTSLGDTELLIGQGYRQNNAGDYSEAEEYFRTDLLQAAQGSSGASAAALAARNHEVLANRALQLSNLGRYEEAARIFAEARNLNLRDPIQSRLLRNFEAIDALNRGQQEEARMILARPVPGLSDPVATDDGAVAIDPAISNSLNSGLAAGLTDAVAQEARLTTVERATILDAQARQLSATAARLDGQPAVALTDLTTALGAIRAIREGRVISTARLEAQLLSEMALANEALGQSQQAESLLREALALVQLRYPEGASVGAAKARLASFLARHDQGAAAREIYRGIVALKIADNSSLVGMANQFTPYFDMLTVGDARDVSAGDLFAAAQTIQRPGAARTLSQLSRRLEAGDSAASDLFRRENGVRRELNRLDLELAQYQADSATPAPAEALAELGARRQRLLDSQVELINGLAAYPAYRSLASNYLSLEDLRASLRADEAYLKLVKLGDSLYAVFVSPTRATGWKVAATTAAVDDLVGKLRDSITVEIGGVNATYPFDVASARDLYEALFGPVSAELGTVHHLIFEPDGPLMELPVNLLIMSQDGVDAYNRRLADGGDEYDFRGIAWLGRDRAISTALSPASFRDARRVTASTASKPYLGLGQNLPVGSLATRVQVRGIDGTFEAGCEIPLAAWNRPIPADELVFASRELASDPSALMTGAAFTDTAIQQRADLNQYRIVHFATHGIVTAPRVGCPARPALLTSFGGEGSDGLLQFGDIFDLSLDADLVILSACNTASLAGLESTREAGLEDGGDQALDGLVRAFIGAGGRQVIASHWPAPEEFDATKRLFQAFFANQKSQPIGVALQTAQRELMDDAATSHPFYWSGFALIGDGERTLSGAN